MMVVVIMIMMVVVVVMMMIPYQNEEQLQMVAGSKKPRSRERLTTFATSSDHHWQLFVLAAFTLTVTLCAKLTRSQAGRWSVALLEMRPPGEGSQWSLAHRLSHLAVQCPPQGANWKWNKWIWQCVLLPSIKLFPVSSHLQDNKRSLSSREGVPSEKDKTSW